MSLRRGGGAHRELPEEPSDTTEEPVVVIPVRSLSMRQRLDSPWLVLIQYIFNVAMVILILMLFFNQARFTDYLNGKGEQRDQEKIQAEEDAAARAERSRQVLCDLIAALEADIGGNLERISRTAGCDDGPIQPTPSPTTPPASTPLDDSESSSTAGPNTDTEPPAGDGGTGAPGPRSPAPPAPATPTQPPPSGPGPTEEPPPPPEGPGDDGGVTVCLPIVGCVV